MIVPMKRVTVLCVAGDRNDAVTRLRALGMLHVAAERVAGGEELEDARRQLERARTALAGLPAGSDGATPAPRGAASLVDDVLRLVHERRELDGTLAQLGAERAAIAPFGDFDPDQARELAAHGLVLRLYQFPAKGELPPVPAGASLQVVGEGGGSRAAVLLGPPSVALAAREVPLPERSLGACERELGERRERRAAIERELAGLATSRDALVGRIGRLEDEVQFAEAKAAMGSHDGIAWLSGYCPASAVPRLTEHARSAGWALVVAEPSKDEPVPTLLESRPWIRQVHAVLEMIGITPGYAEPDVSPLFLIFLVLFAAMLIGDAGYGALMLVGVLAARRKYRTAPAQPFHLLRTIALATIAWGAVTGTWFAIPAVPAALDVFRVEWLAGADKLATTKHVMLLCFFLGAAHLTIAHVWAAMRAGRSLTALAQFGWIATTWCMFFVARTMVLGDPFPGVMMPITIAGIAAIVLFMTPVRQLKDEWFNHVMLPLSLVSNFVDVVSYLRLFAVGTAGVAVASSFNDMAARIGAGGGADLVVAALVAIFGHTLNLLLCAMGVLVHGVRLNTLEFSAHLGMQWSGVPYRPLRDRGPAPLGADGVSGGPTPSATDDPIT